MVELAPRLKEFFDSGYRGVTVAVSGGCDSQALLAMLDNVMPSLQLFVMHFNFRLRAASSDLDAQLVATTAKTRQLPFYLYTVEDKECALRTNTQEWARTIRQRQLLAHAEHFRHVIALAHHLDDLGENAIYRLTKGVTPEYLLGMQEFDPPFWRPLLAVTKQHLENFCRQHRVFYRTDRSNADNVYARNRLRNQVMPILTTINRRATQQVVTTLSEIEQLYRQTRLELQTTYCEDLHRRLLPSKVLQQLPLSKVRIVVSLLLPMASRQLVEQIITKLRAGHSFSYQLPAKTKAVSDGKFLRRVDNCSTVKLMRRQQYLQIVHNCQHIAVLEPQADADIGDGLRLSNAEKQRQLYRLRRPLAKERVSWRGKRRLFKEIMLEMKIGFPESLAFYVQVDDDKSCPTLLKINRFTVTEGD